MQIFPRFFAFLNKSIEIIWSSQKKVVTLQR